MAEQISIAGGHKPFSNIQAAIWISEFRKVHCAPLANLLTPEPKLIQFDLGDLYLHWNNYFGDKDTSFHYFLSIYHNDLLLLYGLKESILALNRLDVEKWKYKPPLEDWQKMNILLKCQEVVYHLVNLTIILRIHYERFILCLQELFKCPEGKRFEAKRRVILKKIKQENIDEEMIQLIEAIDINKIKSYRDRITHCLGLYFEEFFPSTKNNLNFDEYLIEIRNEIINFYELMRRFVYLQSGKQVKLNLKLEPITAGYFEEIISKIKGESI